VNIHPTAIVDPGAELGADVVVGPFTIIGANVVIGDRTVVGPHVHITGNTSIGNDCAVHFGAALGEPPQDHKYHNETSYVRIGDRNILREYVTVHLAVGEGKSTVLGNDNMIMAYCHIGHNCVVGNNVCMANYVGLSGGCRIDDRVVIGGMAGLHQYVHAGRMAMIGGHSKVAHDVPPFVTVDGPTARVYGLNVIGLRRAGFSPETRAALKKAMRLLCYEKGNLSGALAEARLVLPSLPEVEEFLSFMELSGRSGRHLDPSKAKVLSLV